MFLSTQIKFTRSICTANGRAYGSKMADDAILVSILTVMQRSDNLFTLCLRLRCPISHV